jgi:hypothetical protein
MQWEGFIHLLRIIALIVAFIGIVELNGNPCKTRLDNSTQVTTKQHRKGRLLE